MNSGRRRPDRGVTRFEAVTENLAGGAIDSVPVGTGVGAALERPNGVIDSLAFDGLVVAPFGSNVLYVLDEDGARVDISELPGGGLDGVVETADGRLLVTSWGGSAVYAVAVDGSVDIVAENLPAPADLGYDAGRGVVMIPLFNDDAVVILSADSSG